MKISPATVINMECHNHQQFLASRCEMRAPQTAIQRMLPPPRVIAEELGQGKKPGEQRKRIDPRELRCIWKEWIQRAQRLASSIHRMLNFLTWYLIFDVQTACSLCYKFVYRLTSLLASLEQFDRATEMLSPGLRVLNIPTKKNNSLFSCCDCIFQLMRTLDHENYEIKKKEKVSCFKTLSFVAVCYVEIDS